MNLGTWNLRTAMWVFVIGFTISLTVSVLTTLRLRFLPSEDLNVFVFQEAKTPSALKELENREEESVTPAWDYPWELENDYTLSANSEFDVTLVTYFDAKDVAFLKPYFSRWDGAFSIVVYYHEDEKDKMDSFVNTCKMNKRTQCHSFLLQSSTIPINKLKNIGILHVRTTHFIFAERNLSPTTNLYSELLRTPGYLWRDPFFAGVVPVFEWANEAYDDAKAAYQKYDAIPNGPKSLKQCLESYHCRPLQTTTIPMQFRWFSFINYRAMHCLGNTTESYFVLKKTSYLEEYDEEIVERGYDNVLFTEWIRRSNFKIAQLCNNFLFRVDGVGVDSDTVVANRERADLKVQFEQRREELERRVPNAYPIATCGEIENAMYSWLSMKPYSWMRKTTKNGVLYPKIAVEAMGEPTLDV